MTIESKNSTYTRALARFLYLHRISRGTLTDNSARMDHRNLNSGISDKICHQSFIIDKFGYTYQSIHCTHCSLTTFTTNFTTIVRGQGSYL